MALNATPIEEALIWEIAFTPAEKIASAWMANRNGYRDFGGRNADVIRQAVALAESTVSTPALETWANLFGCTDTNASQFEIYREQVAADIVKAAVAARASTSELQEWRDCMAMYNREQYKTAL